jgi:hypothetical protein
MALYKVLEPAFIGVRLYREGEIAEIDDKFGPEKSPCLVACDEHGEPVVVKKTKAQKAEVEQAASELG